MHRHPMNFPANVCFSFYLLFRPMSFLFERFICHISRKKRMHDKKQQCSRWTFPDILSLHRVHSFNFCESFLSFACSKENIFHTWITDPRVFFPLWVTRTYLMENLGQIFVSSFFVSSFFVGMTETSSCHLVPLEFPFEFFVIMFFYC